MRSSIKLIKYGCIKAWSSMTPGKLESILGWFFFLVSIASRPKIYSLVLFSIYVYLHFAIGSHAKAWVCFLPQKWWKHITISLSLIPYIAEIIRNLFNHSFDEKASLFYPFIIRRLVFIFRQHELPSHLIYFIRFFFFFILSFSFLFSSSSFRSLAIISKLFVPTKPLYV